MMRSSPRCVLNLLITFVFSFSGCEESTHSGLSINEGDTTLIADANGRGQTEDSDTEDAARQPVPGVREIQSLEATFDNVHAHILVPGCAVSGCHDSGNQSGDLDLETVENAYAALVSIPANNVLANENGWLRVRPGALDTSFLVRKLTGPGVGEGMAMPSPAQTLTPEWLTLLTRWIEADALPPTGESQIYVGEAPLFGPRAIRELTFRDPIRNCITCHPTHVREWQISNHAYAAVDPVFHAMVKVGQRQTGGRLGQFCVQCHSPVGLALGETPVRAVGDTFVQDFSRLSDVGKMGVSCDVCHTVTAINEPRNARMVYTPDGTMRATIEDPVETVAHLSEYSPLHGESELCGSCHNVTNPAGAPIEETFDEWAASPPEGRKTCQGCHMPAYMGPAAVDGPVREVHRHTFVGVDVSLLPPDEFPGYDEMRGLTQHLLQNTVEFESRLIRRGRELVVSMTNKAGHSLPSGATAERQLWIEVIVQDHGRITQFESGTLDENGDLRDDEPSHTLRPGSDPQLNVWRQTMYGMESKVEFPWQAKRVSNRLILSGQTETVRYELPELADGTYTIQVRLLFRAFPPYFLRLLEEEAELDPMVKTRVPVVEMAKTNDTFVVNNGNEPPPGSGDSDCDAGDILDCENNCRPVSWRGDGQCDDGAFGALGGANFACQEHEFDAGDCGEDGQGLRCAADESRDCDGACWPTGWLADDWCDDGTEQPWGSANFQCAAYNWDRGDCRNPDARPEDRPAEGQGMTEEGCIHGFLRDCQEVCQPMEWLGDDDCDDGTNPDYVNADFNCEAFENDAGDCQ